MAEGTETPSDSDSPTAPSDRSRQTVSDRLRDPARVEALTDGVFAIVITILVLEVAVPANLNRDSLRRVLEDLRPTLVAWVISFLIVGVYWVAHRDLFARLRSCNRDLVWLNLLFLLPVCLIPFGASVIGEYPDEPIAVHIYGMIVSIAALMRLALYWYVVRRPQLLWEQSVDREERVGLLIAAALIPVYVAAMVVAQWSTELSKLIFFGGPVIYFLMITLLRERPSTRAEAEEFD